MTKQTNSLVNRYAYWSDETFSHVHYDKKVFTNLSYEIREYVGSNSSSKQTTFSRFDLDFFFHRHYLWKIFIKSSFYLVLRFCALIRYVCNHTVKSSRRSTLNCLDSRLALLLVLCRFSTLYSTLFFWLSTTAIAAVVVVFVPQNVWLDKLCITSVPYSQMRKDNVNVKTKISA